MNIKLNIKQSYFNETYLPYLDNQERFTVCYGGAGSGNLTYITSSFITGSYIVASPVVSSNNHNLFRLLYVNGYIIGILSGSIGSTVISKKVNINL